MHKTVNGLTLRIEHDECPDCNPRENDNLGTIIAYHRDYLLSDGEKRGKRVNVEEVRAFQPKDHAVCLPVYMYEHSGVALSTGKSYPFDCPWDAGQIGWIYVDRQKLLSEYSTKIITAKVRAHAEDVLRSEVEEFGKYLNGEVYGFVVEDEDGNHLDSCWGFIGFEHAESQASVALAICLADRTAKADADTDAQRSEN